MCIRDSDVPADQVRRVCEVLEMRPLRLVAYELAPEAALAREPERGDAQLAYAGPVGPSRSRSSCVNVMAPNSDSAWMASLQGRRLA